MPSVQLETYLQARADGAPVEIAAELSGIGLGEARLHEADIESGDLVLPQPTQGGRTTMAREDLKTSIRVGDGPEVSIDLSKDINAPENTDAKEQIGGMLRNTAGVAGEELRLLIERVERLEEEKKGIGEDISDVFNEAKSRGFDTKTMKRIIKLRKMEPHARQEAEALLDTYMDALGMTPIEQAIALAA